MTGSIRPSKPVSRPFILGVAGGSGSGKTHFCKALREAVGGDRCELVYQDNFYIDQSKRFDHDGGSVNFDHPSSLDFDLLADRLEALKSGQTVQIPTYDFATHSRQQRTETVEPKSLIIVDGILIFHPARVRNLFDARIFFETPEEVRFQRRLERDVVERGRTAEGVRAQFERQVKPMHDEFVEPSKTFADTLVKDPQGYADALAGLVRLMTLSMGMIACVLTGCASTPDFTPSRPVKSVTSLNEGLMVCSEYRPPDLAERAHVLKPYVDCINEVNERFPAPAQSAAPIFRDELRSRYGSLSEGEWSPELGRDLGIAIRAALRALWSEGGRAATFTHLERRLALQHFPISASSLEAERWQTTGSLVLDFQLERTKAALASIEKPKGRPLLGVPLDRLADWCGRLSRLQKDLDYLQALWGDITRMAQLSAAASTRAQVERKFRLRLVEVERDVHELHEKVRIAQAESAFSQQTCQRGNI